MQSIWRLGGGVRASLSAALLVLLSAFTMSAHSASKTILVLGDSLSAEYGLARGEGWVSLLQQQLRQDNIDATVINASISGETTSGGRARLQPLLDKHRPSVVVIELGANDALRGLPLAGTEDNLRFMTAAAQKIAAKPMLVGIQIPPNYGTDYTRKFAAIFPALAREKKVALVPFMLTGVADKPELFQADRIHPSAAAHPLILRNIWPHLKPLLK